ncbi:MAG: hypothetical protein LAP38_20600 [Acidobacteriia bacterium]|nr:hypothetical protein [Terriglobia bacterium]
MSDLKGNVATFPSRATALEQARRLAAAGKPAQVVLIDEYGQIVPIARYRLPDYPSPQLGRDNGGSVFEAAVKSLVIGGFLAAGVAVLGDLVASVDRQLKEETAKSKDSRKRTRRRRAA